MPNIKNNRIFRVSGLILLVTIISICLLSFTLAKYLTSTESPVHEAKVAKWGIELDVQGGLFYDEYSVDDGNEGLFLTVKSSTEDNFVLAPGTSNIHSNDPFTLTLKCPEEGPEVAYKVTINSGLIAEDWTVLGDVEYFPINWYVNGILTEFSVLEDAFNSVNGVENYYEPGENFMEDLFESEFLDLFKDGVCEITWEWPFEKTEEKEKYNAYDTYLGNQAANGDPATIELTFDIKIEQVVEQPTTELSN